MIDYRFIKSIKELEELLYYKLRESKDGELSFNEILDVFDLKQGFGLRKVSGGAISLIREREDVEQVKDEKGRNYLRLIKKENEDDR